MSFKNLNPQQQNRFASTNKKLGLQEEEATHGTIDHPKGKTIVYSSDPNESDVPPKLVTVNSIQEFKKMVGMDDGSQPIGKAAQITPNFKVLDSIQQVKSVNISEGKPLKQMLSEEQKVHLKKKFYFKNIKFIPSQLYQYLNNFLFEKKYR